MNRIYTILFLLFLETSSTFGQVRVGATAGFQAATHTPEEVGTQNKFRAGFLAGVMFDIPLSATVSLRPRVLYSTKGVRKSALSTFNATLSLNYIEVPVQLVYNADSDAGRLSFGAGLYVAYGLSSKTVVTSAGQTKTFTDDFGTSADQFKRTDIGARFSVDFALKSGLSLGIFYAPGLANLNNPSTVDNVATHNSSIGIAVGYWLKKR